METNELIIQVLEREFKRESEEVFEVAMYIMSVIALDQLIENSVVAGDTEVRGIPAEALYLTRKFDNGLVKNEFYQINFAPIKCQLQLMQTKLNTMRNFIKFEQDKPGNERVLLHVIAIIQTQFDALTTLAFLWKGQTFADEFDARLRFAINLPDKVEQYMRDKKVLV